MSQDLNTLSKTQLLEKCQELQLKKYKSKNKKELIELIVSKTIPIEPQPEGDNELLTLVKRIIKTFNLQEISKRLNVSPSTISRWIELKSVPPQYKIDILKLSGIDIDYSKFTTKEKDQFFTPITTARYCYEIFKNKLLELGDDETKYTYIEPSAGDGSFLNVLPLERTIAYDIEPRHSFIQKEDYLEWYPENRENKYVVFGNPPFGLRGHLALRFINHSYEFADYVCFILPQLFESDGKGVPRKRVNGYNLIHSQKLETRFYEPNKTEIEIHTIFQIWSKHHKNEEYELDETINPYVKIYSMSDGGSSSSTRNKNKIGKCDIYLPSTCFGKEYMKAYDSFDELPNKRGYGLVFTDTNDISQTKHSFIEKAKRIDWSSISFLSTNSAYNLRSSQIYSQFT